MKHTPSQLPQADRPTRRPRISRKTAVAAISETVVETPLPAVCLRAKATPALPSDSTKTRRPIAKSGQPQALPVTPTKQSMLIALLERKLGATMDELLQATGWQPHSVRGVISGVLRKRLGLVVHAELIDGVRHYRIIAAA